MAGIHILNGDTLAQTFVSDPIAFGRDRQSITPEPVPDQYARVNRARVNHAKVAPEEA